MALIPFPNVPQVPGVPAIFRETTIPSLPELVNIGLGGLAELFFGTPCGACTPRTDSRLSCSIRF